MSERSTLKPSIVSLDEAIGNIVETRNRRVPAVRYPFVFVVGAGISYPSIELAGWITDRCEERARARAVCVGPESNTPMDRYSYWFDKAYGSRAERQEYIQSLVESDTISAANFRLAHLLMADFSNLVVTSNFDALLSRALRLFGYHKFRLCDHPATTARIIPDLPQTQIIHVHGTFQFYDIANLKGEVDERARREMAELLDAIFRDRVPIVIGYSGWDGDVITRALKRRLTRRNHPLPYALYWFCHNWSSLDQLCSLDWLLSNDAVRFVVPAQGSKLSAEKALGSLIRQMGYEEPDLALRPVRYVAELLEESLPKGKGQPDPYSLVSVAARIHRAADLEQEDFKETSNYMERIRSDVRKARYEEAVETVDKLPLDRLNNYKQQELLEKIEEIMPFVSKAARGKLLHVKNMVKDKLKDWVMLQDALLSNEEESPSDS